MCRTQPSVLSNSIPSDFSLELNQRPGAPVVGVADFWRGAFGALLTSILGGDFTETSTGFDRVQNSISFSIAPVSTSSQLQSRHVIWAIQSLCETMYRQHSYQEVQGTLMDRSVQVGNLSLISSRYESDDRKNTDISANDH